MGVDFQGRRLGSAQRVASAVFDVGVSDTPGQAAPQPGAQQANSAGSLHGLVALLVAVRGGGGLQA